MKSLGELAYDAYGKTTDYKNFMGNPMPKWSELPEKIKEAWENAANAIVQIVTTKAIQLPGGTLSGADAQVWVDHTLGVATI